MVLGQHGDWRCCLFTICLCSLYRQHLFVHWTKYNNNVFWLSGQKSVFVWISRLLSLRSGGWLVIIIRLAEGSNTWGGKQQQKKEVITKMLHYNVKILEKMYGGCHFGAKHLNCTQPAPLLPSFLHFGIFTGNIFVCFRVNRSFACSCELQLHFSWRCTSVQWAGAQKTFSTGVGSVLLE